MDVDMMLFHIDLNGQKLTNKNTDFKKNEAVPSAPPPSPDFNSRRKTVSSSISFSKLFECCEDLVSRANKLNISSPPKTSPLSMKRKTSDVDNYFSSGSSSPNSASYSCSVGSKRSRSSFNLNNYPLFQESDFQQMSISTQS